MTIIAIYGSTDKILPYVAVAPHVGAWIEISVARFGRPAGLSLPMWERGLKSLIQQTALSAPVAPHVGAWIEIRNIRVYSRGN